MTEDYPYETAGDQLLCKTCGELIPRGIISASDHWVNCVGQSFTQELLRTREDQSNPLTAEQVEKIRKKHIK